MLLVWKPGSVVRTIISPRMASPDVMSSTRHTLICTTTNRSRAAKNLPRLCLPADAPSSLSADARSTLDACNAGASPKTMPVPSDNRNV